MDLSRVGFVKWIGRNKSVALVVLLLVLFLALGFFSKPPASGEKESAIDFALKDATSAYPNASIRAINAERAGNKWKVDVKIVMNGHSACPTVFVRKYELFPIFFREEQIIKNCAVSGTLVFEEEAVAVSAKAGLGSAAAARGALGYATYFSKDALEGTVNCTSCPQVLPPAVAGVLEGVPPQNLWVVEWRDADSSVFVALSEKGGVLAEKAA